MVPQLTPAGGDLVDLSAYFRIPMGAASLRAFVTTHPPTGTVGTGGGTSGGPGVPTLLSLIFGMARLPAFAQVANLEYSFQSAPHQDAYLRLDSQVVWRPVRSPGTFIPRSDRVATADIRGTGGGLGPEPRIFQLQGRALDDLIATLNSEPTVAPGLVGCGLVDEEITVSFFSKATTSPPNASIQIEVACAAFQLKTSGGSVELQSQPTVGLLSNLFPAGKRG